MKCLNCGNDFIEKRTIKTLFSIHNYKVCTECIKKYPFNPSFSVIPLKDKYKLEIVSLYQKKEPINCAAFSEQYEAIKIEIMKTHLNFILLEEKEFKLDEKRLLELEKESSKNQKDILIITFFYIDKALS